MSAGGFPVHGPHDHGRPRVPAHLNGTRIAGPVIGKGRR